MPRVLPTHVGVVMDGNRRWAKKAGFANPGAGHDVGADHVEDLLGWCARWRSDHLTSYVRGSGRVVGWSGGRPSRGSTGETCIGDRITTVCAQRRSAWAAIR